MSIEFFSDYIMFTHMPSKLNLRSYTDEKYPILLTDGNDTTEFIYWHITKNREGTPDQIIPMLNNLKYYDFEEVDLADFDRYHKEFISKGTCNK